MKVWTGTQPLARGMVQPAKAREKAGQGRSSHGRHEQGQKEEHTVHEDAREDDEVDDRCDDRSQSVGRLVVGQDSKRDLDVEDGGDTDRSEEAREGALAVRLGGRKRRGVGQLARREDGSRR